VILALSRFCSSVVAASAALRLLLVRFGAAPLLPLEPRAEVSVRLEPTAAGAETVATIAEDCF